MHIYSLFFKRENTPFLVPSLSFSHYELVPDFISGGQGQENQGELLKRMESKGDSDEKQKKLPKYNHNQGKQVSIYHDHQGSALAEHRFIQVKVKGG